MDDMVLSFVLNLGSLFGKIYGSLSEDVIRVLDSPHSDKTAFARSNFAIDHPPASKLLLAFVNITFRIAVKITIFMKNS